MRVVKKKQAEFMPTTGRSLSQICHSVAVPAVRTGGHSVGS
jgi:hypothetical protein